MKLFFIVIFLFTVSLFAKEVTTVQSDSAHYDGTEVILKGSVIVENTLGKIDAEVAKLLRSEDGKSKIDFPKLELHENVVAHLFNGSFLKCQSVYLDYDSLTGYFTGSDEKQVYYHDEMGEIYAEKVQINYIQSLGIYKPVKITLLDRVQLINRSSLTKGKEKETLQYALADLVEYFPNEEIMILRASEGKNVLFFDKVKDMQLSARMVKGQRNSQGGQSLQGIGDVRFMFGQEELEKFKKNFNLE